MRRRHVVRWSVVIAVSILLPGCAAPLVSVIPPVRTAATGKVGEVFEKRGDHRVLEQMLRFPEGHDHQAGPPVELSFSLPAEEMSEAWKRAYWFLAFRTTQQLEQDTETALPTGGRAPN